MKNVELNQNKIVLLVKMLQGHISTLNADISESEETVEEKGRNASIVIKVSEATRLLTKLQ